MKIDDTFLLACRKKKVEKVPVWYMRQAGRYDPDYRKIKEKFSLLEICKQPELAAEITLTPVRKLGVDAAILYSDIMIPVSSIGIQFDIVPGVGPVVHNPIRSGLDVANLQPIQVEAHLSHVLETIRLLNRELNVPLIAFAGAPFTLASYLIEGKPSRNYMLTKQLLYREPETWELLMNKLGDMIVTYLRAQIDAGAQAIQLFDSWVGALAPSDFVKSVLPTITRIFTELEDKEAVKIYYPGVSSGELLPYLSHLPVDVVGLDWRVPIREGRQRLKHRFAIQGNLDPMVLQAPMTKLKATATEILEEGMLEPGFVFNLGHGLFPEASLETVQELTHFIHTYSADALRRK